MIHCEKQAIYVVRPEGPHVDRAKLIAHIVANKLPAPAPDGTYAVNHPIAALWAGALTGSEKELYVLADHLGIETPEGGYAKIEMKDATEVAYNNPWAAVCVIGTPPDQHTVKVCASVVPHITGLNTNRGESE